MYGPKKGVLLTYKTVICGIQFHNISLLGSIEKVHEQKILPTSMLKNILYYRHLCM